MSALNIIVLSNNNEITEMRNSWRLSFLLLKCMNYIIQYVAVTSFQIPPQPKAVTRVRMITAAQSIVKICINSQVYVVEL